MLNAITPSICFVVALVLPVSAFGAVRSRLFTPGVEQHREGEAQRGDDAIDASRKAYDTWLLSLGAARDATNDDPVHAPTLALVLDEVPTFAHSLGDDAAGRHLRNEGLLALARAYLVSGDNSRARQTMNEAIRSAGGYLDAKRYGPKLAALYRDRLVALTGAGGAAIKVDCRTPCRVFLNERPAAADSRHLPEGPYRVRIVATDAAHAPLDLPLLTQPGGSQHITFPAISEGPTPAASVNLAKEASPRRRADSMTRSRRRTLPRWLEITAMIGGAAAVGTGAFLVLSEERCIGDRQTMPTSSSAGRCPRIYAAQYPGFALIGAGSFLFTGGLVTLSIDEILPKKDRQAVPQSPHRRMMLGYRRAF